MSNETVCVPVKRAPITFLCLVVTSYPAQTELTVWRTKWAPQRSTHRYFNAVVTGTTFAYLGSNRADCCSSLTEEVSQCCYHGSEPGSPSARSPFSPRRSGPIRSR